MTMVLSWSRGGGGWYWGRWRKFSSSWRMDYVEAWLLFGHTHWKKGQKSEATAQQHIGAITIIINLVAEREGGGRQKWRMRSFNGFDGPSSFTQQTHYRLVIGFLDLWHIETHRQRVKSWDLGQDDEGEEREQLGSNHNPTHKDIDKWSWLLTNFLSMRADRELERVREIGFKTKRPRRLSHGMWRVLSQFEDCKCGTQGTMRAKGVRGGCS